MPDLRKSLLLKVLSIILLTVSVFTAALGVGGIVLLGDGHGTARSYQEDILFTSPMEQAMYLALSYATDSGDRIFYSDQLESQYAGTVISVYEDGALLDTWGESYSRSAYSHTLTAVRSGKTYTVTGYLPSPIPYNSVFYFTHLLYNVLHPLMGARIVILLASSLLLSVLLLIWLLCAAGHRKGRDGITPCWQDRVPLDLYLAVMGITVCCVAALGVQSLSLASYNGHFRLYACLVLLCALLAGLLTLAVLMSLATRFKLGNWWRNSLCYLTLRWLWRLVRCCCRSAFRFLALLPVTWRAVLAICCILGGQTLLTLLMFNSTNEGFFFLITLAADLLLIIAAARMSHQFRRLKDAGAALAAGDLDIEIDTRHMGPDARAHAAHLSAIGEGMNRAVEQRMKSERLKTELITNVSHDIKTPLTSIVNYTDLLKKEELSPTAAEYVAVLDRQAHRLKKLTEDLVEASKASTGNLSVNLEPIIVNEIIHQAVGDYDEKLAAGRLEVIFNTYEGNLQAIADGRLLWRVLDNLLSNICKYALAGTRVYIDLAARGEWVILSLKNISRDPLNVCTDDLMERFVRGDVSRHTEGSGLGLNIAKSLMDLMGGAFALSVDGDLFKAELALRAADSSPTYEEYTEEDASPSTPSGIRLFLHRRKKN